MSAQHTPGPWTVDEYRTGTEGVVICWAIHGQHKTSVARGQSQEHVEDGIHEAECRANAHLIAAAPDLLAALQALDARGHTEGVWVQAKRAMAKATGGDA